MHIRNKKLLRTENDVETVVQLVRKKPDTYLDVKIDMKDIDVTPAEAKATYDEIKDYIFEKYSVKVSSLNIAQVKEKYGIKERENYNKSKNVDAKQPQCPKGKEQMIIEALKHFKIVYSIIIYDSRTNTTATAAKYIQEGAENVTGVKAECFHISEADNETVRSADAVILGSPTYMASVTAAMQTWLQTVAPKLGFSGKLGGAFATEQYIHGGAENVISSILTCEMVLGMMTYSGGDSFGKPVIHLGPVGMSQNIENFHELFTVYGMRFAAMLAKVGG